MRDERAREHPMLTQFSKFMGKTKENMVLVYRDWMDGWTVYFRIHASISTIPWSNFYNPHSASRPKHLLSFFNFRLGTYNVPSGSSAKSITRRPKAGRARSASLMGRVGRVGRSWRVSFKFLQTWCAFRTCIYILVSKIKIVTNILMGLKIWCQVGGGGIQFSKLPYVREFSNIWFQKLTDIRCKRSLG